MKKLLLVDDDAGVRELWTHWHDKMELTFRGRNPLETASDLVGADSLLAEGEYDIVIIDLGLPPGGTDGTIQWVKEKSKIKDFPPIVVITGNDDVMLRQKCMIAGAAQYFTKHDAQHFPNSFFKICYNEYLKFYGSKEDTNSPPSE